MNNFLKVALLNKLNFRYVVMHTIFLLFGKIQKR